MNKVDEMFPPKRIRTYYIYSILALALVLRLAVVASADRGYLYTETGGDSWWYLEYGRALVRGQEPASPPSGPIYLIFVGYPQALDAPDRDVVFIRALRPFGYEPFIQVPEMPILIIQVVQAILGTVTCYFAYRLARAISRDERAGLLVAGVLAISPVFVLETTQVLTETLYLFLLSGGLWLYIRGVDRASGLSPTAVLVCGVILGVATLTRAVLLAFPVGLALHLLVAYGWRRGARLALILIVAYVITLSPWTIYNKLKWNQIVIGAQGFAAFLFIGATEWQGPQGTDQNLAQEASVNGEFPTDPGDQQGLYASAASKSILGDPIGWLSRRANALASALLQLHGTLFFPGESLKDALTHWMQDDRSLDGLLRVSRGDGFWPKLVIYVLHFGGWLLGLAGMWLTRKQWRISLPLVGLVAYTLLVHFVLDAIPRYLFPLDLVMWVFAGASLVRFMRAIQAKPVEKRLQEHGTTGILSGR